MFRNRVPIARKINETSNMSRRTSTSSSNFSQSSVNQQRPHSARRNSITDDLFTESINVIVRCRGRGHCPNEEGSPNVVSVPSDGTPQVKIVIPEEARLSTNDRTATNGIESTRKYSLDQVYGPSSDQTTFFQNAAENICDEFLKGYNCTIFAYGQTGAGKTYTMCGKVNSESLTPESGVIPRCLKKLFDSELNKDVVLKCSFVEIYNEVLKDLLSDGTNDGKLKIYEENKLIKIKSLEEFYIRDFKEAMRMLKIGIDKRKTASTKMNKLSSRSHSIFTIYLMKKVPNGSEYRFAKMNLVDLAGSENVNRAGSINQRAKEAGSINQSLLTLGRVINCLVDDSSFVPYRESKLTRLLQDSLGGRTKTVLIANIAPTLVDLQSTISTLEYASKAKNIKNTAQIGPLVAEDYIMNDLIEANRRLKLDLLATRKRENCIVMDDVNYNEMHLTQKALKDEVEELRGLKISLLNQMDSQMKKIDLNKSEKKILNENIQSLEQKLLDFKDKLGEQRRQEEQLKMRCTKLYEKFAENLSAIYQSQISTRSVLSDQILKSLVDIGSKLASIEADDTILFPTFKKIKEDLNKTCAQVDDLIKSEENISLGLNQSCSRMNDLNALLISNKDTLLNYINKLSGVAETQASLNKKFHIFLEDFMNHDDTHLLSLIHKEAGGKMNEFKKEFNQKMDNIMNESIEHHYGLFLKHYKRKLSVDEKPWIAASEELVLKSKGTKELLTEMLGSQQENLSNIASQSISNIKSGQTDILLLKESLNSISNTTRPLINQLSSTLKTQSVSNKQVNLAVNGVREHVGKLECTVKEVIGSDNVDLEARREEVCSQMKEITEPENVNILKSSSNVMQPTSSSCSTKSSPLRSTIRLIPSKSPSRNSAELRSPTRSPMRGRYGSPPKSPYKSPSRRQGGNSLAFGLKRESSADSLREAKRTHN